VNPPESTRPVRFGCQRDCHGPPLRALGRLPRQRVRSWLAWKNRGRPLAKRAAPFREAEDWAAGLELAAEHHGEVAAEVRRSRGGLGETVRGGGGRGGRGRRGRVRAVRREAVFGRRRGHLAE